MPQISTALDQLIALITIKNKLNFLEKDYSQNKNIAHVVQNSKKRKAELLRNIFVLHLEQDGMR